MIDPLEDGVTHVNVYSRGKTALGRWLSNFTLAPFTHPKYGYFASVEGFWYWLSTGKKHDCLRDMFGWEAKSMGKTFESIPCDNFEQIIKTAIRAKLIANPIMLRKLIDCPLPLEHYYVYGNKPVDAGYKWITDYITEIRSSCVARGYYPDIP